MRAALAAACALAACAPDGAVEWQLAWADDFDGPAGARPDPTKWSFEVGGHGWGNQELQFYTERPENAALDGAGTLAITARREPWQARAYTSARLTTRGRFEQTHGRFEARLQLPAGKGLWPAFWMLGADSDEWPARGEIDVMESRGAQPWRVSSAVHGPGYAGGNALSAAFDAPAGESLAGGFHLYAVEWESGELRFFIDGRRYHTVRATRLPAGGRWVFERPFFVILNLAVGGTFGGAPDEGTAWPQSLRADYVRAYVR